VVTTGGRRIYVASSWRCHRQPVVVGSLLAAGHEVYDFRHPDSGGPPGEPGSTRDKGFSWSEIDPDWQGWDAATFTGLLMTHQTAAEGFKSDADALAWCDTCVLVLPCGRSAHLEAGWAKGAGKRLVILLDEQNEPELMYRFADAICLDLDELMRSL
jgi:hypothetical protein